MAPRPHERAPSTYDKGGHMHSDTQRPRSGDRPAAHDAAKQTTEDQTAGLRPLLVSVTQALRLLGIGRTTLYELIADGRVAPVKIGRSVRFVVDELEDFVETLRAARGLRPPSRCAGESQGLR